MEIWKCTNIKYTKYIRRRFPYGFNGNIPHKTQKLLNSEWIHRVNWKINWIHVRGRSIILTSFLWKTSLQILYQFVIKNQTKIKTYFLWTKIMDLSFVLTERIIVQNRTWIFYHTLWNGNYSVEGDCSRL